MKYGIIELFANAHIKNLKVEPLATDPTIEAMGAANKARLWFNETTKALKFFDGEEIHQLATGGSLTDYIRHDGSIAMTADLVLSSADQSASADNVAVSKGYMVAELAKKENVLTGAATTVAHADLDPNLAIISDASGKIASSTVKASEILALAGMTTTVIEELAKKENVLGFVPLAIDGSNEMAAAIAMADHQITGLKKGTESHHAVTLGQLENAMAGLDFQKDVNGIAVDATLDVTDAVAGDRYIIVDATAIHASFGVIADLENNDIVEFDGTEWSVAYDVSVMGEGALAWNILGGEFLRYDGISWDQFGGLAGVTAGIGLEKEEDEIRVVMGGGLFIGEDGKAVTVQAKGDGSLQLVDPTTGVASGARDAVLAIKLDGVSLETSVAGLKVKAAGITETELAASVAGHGLLGGAGDALAVKAADASLVVDADGVKLNETHTDGIYARQDGATFTAEIGVVDATADNHAMPKSQIVSTINTLAGDKINEFADRFAKSYVSYTAELASLTHEVTHNIGTKNVQVVCYDETDSQFIPDSVVTTDENTVTVTVTESIICRIEVQGMRPAVVEEVPPAE